MFIGKLMVLLVNVNIIYAKSESCIKLHAVAVLELLLSEQCPLLQVCVYLDRSNAENTFHCWLYSV